MNTKHNTYLDLSKLSEEEIKAVKDLTDGYVNEIYIYPLLFWDETEWNQEKKGNEIYTEDLTELTYPEFIKLFEKPKTVSQSLKEYFKNTPKDQVMKDWESVSEFDNVNSPKVSELFEGGEEVRTELLPDVAYWRHRCLLAEKCLSVSPCDPDITEEQIKAHKDYNQYLETFGKKS